MSSRNTSTTAAAAGADGVGARHIPQLAEDSRILIPRFPGSRCSVVVRRASRTARTQYAEENERERPNTAASKATRRSRVGTWEGTLVLACGYIGVGHRHARTGASELGPGGL